MFVFTNINFSIFVHKLDAQPTESEREVYHLAEDALKDANHILKDLQTYKGAAAEIRQVSFTFYIFTLFFILWTKMSGFVTKWRKVIFPVLDCYHFIYSHTHKHRHKTWTHNQHPHPIWILVLLVAFSRKLQPNRTSFLTQTANLIYILLYLFGQFSTNSLFLYFRFRQFQMLLMKNYS